MILRCEKLRRSEKGIRDEWHSDKRSFFCSVMLEAWRQQAVEVERISFADALRWLREARRGEAVPRLKVHPQRRGRVEPRVKKRRPMPYKRMNKPRSVLRNKLLHNNSPPQGDAA
jgi:hypothetical protein